MTSISSCWTLCRRTAVSPTTSLPNGSAYRPRNVRAAAPRSGEAGIIEGYHAAVASQAVGLDVVVFVQVSLATQSADSAQAFGKLIGGMEEVQEAFSLTGEADYLVKMVVPDLKVAVAHPQ